MKLGTLISVSGAIDFPQQNRFHDIKRIEDPKEASPPVSKPPRDGRAQANRHSDRFTRLCLWFVVAVLALAAVA